MTLTPEQVIAANKANLETLVGLTNKAFSGVEQLIELNLAAAKSTLADSQKQTNAALSVKDAQELLALQASLFQPLAEKAVAYNRHLVEIAKVQAHISKATWNPKWLKLKKLSTPWSTTLLKMHLLALKLLWPLSKPLCPLATTPWNRFKKLLSKLPT